jgi:murein DD-endopeptidase MepM/ murein hydrolase activator NlpD
MTLVFAGFYQVLTPSSQGITGTESQVITKANSTESTTLSASLSANAAQAKPQPSELGAFHVTPLLKKNGFILNDYKVTEGEIIKNDFLSTILDRHGINAAQIDQIDRLARALENSPLLIPGKKYRVLADSETGKAKHFIYEPDAYRYYVYTLTDPMEVKEIKHPVERKVVSSSGVITSSLWNAIVGNGMSFAIASKMEDAFQWSVDFHHIQKNDKFRLVYEEDWIEGEKVGVGKLIAAHFNHFDKDYYAIRFKNENYDGFFDPEGRPMKKTFLKAPVKYARISSKFNLRRFHPVLKRVKPHLGTDYAAPYGTPIMAVAAGTIERIGRTRGNGNFIKIKHDKTYATQYLHMQKFAKGMVMWVLRDLLRVLTFVSVFGKTASR